MNSVNRVSKYLTIGMDEELFGIAVEDVREVLVASEITRLPGMPDYTKGVINVRGKAVTVVDLAQKLGMPVIDSNSDTNILVLDLEEDLPLGTIVRNVYEVLEISEEDIEPAPGFGFGIQLSFLKGIAKTPTGFVIILDMKTIFSDLLENEQVLQEISA